MPIEPRVVHVGTADNSGGAARVSFRLHRGLMDLGIQSSMLCGYVVERNRREIACCPEQNTLWQRAFRFAVNKAEQWSGLEYQLLPWKNDFLNHPFVRNANIVHLHNLHGGFFPQRLLPDLSLQKRLVWTIHDMWPVTGHCYYPGIYDCERWKSGCGSCPGLRQDDHYPLSVDTSAFLWKRKRAIYAKTNLTLVAYSQWTLDQIRSSPLLSNRRSVLIPLGLDVETFRPMPKETARDFLKIPRDRKVLFFSAIGLNSPRKGWKYLKEALARLSASGAAADALILTAGDLGPAEKLQSAIPVMSLGYVTDDRIMMLAYNAADLFAGASLFETLGLVFLEAAACGVPSVAFDTSGVRDVVRHMQTGYLAEFKDSGDLAKGIATLLNDDQLRGAMSERCRRMAVDEYSTELQARRISGLYREILG